MTLDDVVQELIQLLAHDGDTLLPWEQVKRWPKGAVDIFQHAGWIIPTFLASEVTCPGCEEGCYMPVDKVIQATNGKPVRAYIACDRRADMGTVKINPVRMQQWQFNYGQLAKWIASSLCLKTTPAYQKESASYKLGMLRGEGGRCWAFLTVNPLAIVINQRAIPVDELLYIEQESLQIDRLRIDELVNQPTSRSKSYIPNIDRQEERKLETQAMYQNWNDAYLKSREKHPKKTDKWHSWQIAKLPIAEGRDSETIRKHMK